MNNQIPKEYYKKLEEIVPEFMKFIATKTLLKEDIKINKEGIIISFYAIDNDCLNYAHKSGYCILNLDNNVYKYTGKNIHKLMAECRGYKEGYMISNTFFPFNNIIQETIGNEFTEKSLEVINDFIKNNIKRM